MSEGAAWRVLARGIGLVFGVLLALFLVGELRSVLVQLLLAILLAAAASPLVSRLSAPAPATARRWRWRPSRGLAALLVFLGGLLVLAAVVELVLATVGPDVVQLAANLPRYGAQAQVALSDLLARNPGLASRLSEGGGLPSPESLLTSLAGLLAQAPRVVGVVTSAVGGVLYGLFSVILALYLTADADHIRRYMIQFLPFAWQPHAVRTSERIGQRLGAWARGEALLAIIIGGLTWLGALAIGLPYAGALALIAAIGELIPNLGPIVAAIPLIAVGLLTSPTQGLLALGLAILVQQLENNLIVPRVMGQAVNLHPVVVMLAILSGGELLGVTGAILAVPTVAALAVVVDEIQQERLARFDARQRVAEEPPASGSFPR